MLKVTDYRPVRDPKNSVVGHVDVVSDKGFTVRNITHMQRGEQDWFSMPAFKLAEKFIPIFSLGNAEVDRAFLLTIKSALKDYFERFESIVQKDLDL